MRTCIGFLLAFTKHPPQLPSKEIVVFRLSDCLDMTECILNVITFCWISSDLMFSFFLFSFSLYLLFALFLSLSVVFVLS